MKNPRARITSKARAFVQPARETRAARAFLQMEHSVLGVWRESVSLTVTKARAKVEWWRTGNIVIFEIVCFRAISNK
jgi:hypothetical protein